MKFVRLFPLVLFLLNYDLCAMKPDFDGLLAFLRQAMPNHQQGPSTTSTQKSSDREMTDLEKAVVEIERAIERDDLQNATRLITPAIVNVPSKDGNSILVFAIVVAERTVKIYIK